MGNTLSGGDYSSLSNTSNLGDLSIFDGKGAIVVVSVPDGTLTTALANLTLDGTLAFSGSATLNDLFPNDHDPLKDNISDFLFFDVLGDFAKNSGAVPDFSSETGAADGEIKTVTVAGMGSLAWIHFDIVALETSANGPNIVTTFENNPGSHDVTWKGDGGGGGGGDEDVPEPGMPALLGMGVLAVLLARRRFTKQG